MSEKVNVIRNHLYQYTEWDILADGRFALFTADLVWKYVSDQGEVLLYSSRGMPMRYTQHEFSRLMDEESFIKTVPPDATDGDVDKLIDTVRRQESYQDAHEYWASRDGSFAVAAWWRYRSIYHLERTGDHFTWVQGGYHDRRSDGLIACDYAAFNPTNCRIVPENAMARRTRMKGRSMLGQIGDAVKTRTQWPDLKDILQFSASEAIRKAVAEACRNG